MNPFGHASAKKFHVSELHGRREQKRRKCNWVQRIELSGLSTVSECGSSRVVTRSLVLISIEERLNFLKNIQWLRTRLVKLDCLFVVGYYDKLAEVMRHVVAVELRCQFSQVLIHFMRVLSVHVDLFEHRELNVSPVGELANLFRRSWFLVRELVAWEGQYLQAFRCVFFVNLN